MPSFDERLADWKHAEQEAESILPLVGALYRDHGVVPMLHGQSLVHLDPIRLIGAHRRGHLAHGHDTPIRLTREVLEAVTAMGVGAVELDVGKLLLEWMSQGQGEGLGAWLQGRCADLPRRPSSPREPVDVVLYGFGRIGRILARLLVAKAGGGDKYVLRAIVVRPKSADELERRANLLRLDSVHGRFHGTVRTLPEDNALLINGQKVDLIFADAPEDVDYTANGIQNAVVIDNTGKWRDRDGLGRHLQAKGVSKVMLTAPGKGDVPNIVPGVNHHTLNPEERIVSVASCTTNAIVPVLKVLDDQYGIEEGHLETVHAYTNDQNLLDNFHKKERRGRSAALNLVITETGAATAVARALPQLEGRLTGNAIRVPTPNVSLAILNLSLRQPVDRDGLHAFLEQVAYDSPLSPQIGFTTVPDVVSTDLVGDTHAGTVDAAATIVRGQRVNLYVWYDNEYGYSTQVMRLLEQITGVTRPIFP